MVISGDRTPRASGQTDRGLGSQQRSLVRRGQRSTVAVRRDAPSWLVGDSPSGAEASSGPPDTCRSTGCGVEKATEIPPVGTPGNRGCPHSYRPFTLREQRRYAPRSLGKRSIKSTPPSPSLRFGSVVGPLARGTRSRHSNHGQPPALPRVTRLSLSFEPRSRPLIAWTNSSHEAALYPDTVTETLTVTLLAV